MDKLYAFFSKVFLLVGLIAIILGVISKFTDLVYFGLYPLSYMRFAGVCLLFVIAASLSQMAAAKAPKKAAAKRKR
jgi:hypothetical protein